MKRLICVLLIGIALISLTACSKSSSNSNAAEIAANYMTTQCSKDYVDEFLTILGEGEMSGLLTGTKLDAEHCYNVTPHSVSNQTDIKIFKFSDSCISLALIDGEVHSICEFFGGYGFVNAVPWDYDSDGNLDLLIASSWGSGLHRSQISVFNTVTKESIMVFDTSSTDDPCIDLFVTTATASFSSEELEAFPVSYLIYSANIEVLDNNLSNLGYRATDIIGSVVVENGVPVFKMFDDEAEIDPIPLNYVNALNNNHFENEVPEGMVLR